MSSPTLISLGYEGRTVADLLAALRSESVSILVDVRLTPLSRKPGMSKRRLAAALEEIGIAYLHLPALGNPRDNREPFRAGVPESRVSFRARLTEQIAARAIHHIAELLDSGVVAVLCFERDHSRCHRHLITDAVRGAKPSVELVQV